MQTGIRDLVAGAFDGHAGGRRRGQVYGPWRELTADAVAEAKARFDEPLDVPPTTTRHRRCRGRGCSGQRPAVRSARHVDADDVTDIVLCFDQNLTCSRRRPGGVRRSRTRPDRCGFTILGRGLGEAYPSWLAAAFPEVPDHLHAGDHVAYGASRAAPPHHRPDHGVDDGPAAPAAAARDASGAVYLDVDTLVLGDVAELSRIDLEGHPVAVRDSNVSEASEWRRAGVGSSTRPQATELRRRMGRLHGYGSPALNAGVLVMDLERMRRDDFTRTVFALVERFGLHDQDTMLAYVGPDRAAPRPAVERMPVLEDVPDPALVHWASLGKPWDPQLTFGQARWTRHADTLKARAGSPPGTGTSRVGASGLTGDWRGRHRRSAEGGGLAAIGRNGLGDAPVVHEVEYVDPLAELAGLGVPEPHPVADGQRVRRRAAQRRLHLAGAFGADQLESGRIPPESGPGPPRPGRMPASHRRPP